MIELSITWTRKGYSPKDHWENCGGAVERFNDMAEAKAWLQECYGKCKRVPMYRDTLGGKPRRSGTIYCFRGEDQDRSAHDGVYRYLGQDWIEVYDVSRKRLVP